MHLLKRDWSILFEFSFEELQVINKWKLSLIFSLPSLFSLLKYIPFPLSNIFNSGSSPHNEIIFSIIWLGADSIPSTNTHSPSLNALIKSDSLYCIWFTGEIINEIFFLVFINKSIDVSVFFSSFNSSIFEFIFFIISLYSGTVKLLYWVSFNSKISLISSIRFSNFFLSNVLKFSLMIESLVNKDIPTLEFIWYSINLLPNIFAKNLIKNVFPEQLSPWRIQALLDKTEHIKNTNEYFPLIVILLNVLIISSILSFISLLS